MKHKKHITLSILASIVLISTIDMPDISLQHYKMLSPESILNNKEKTLFTQRFNTIYKSYIKNIASNTDEINIFDQLDTRPNDTIKMLLQEAFPDRPEILNQYKWMTGFHLCIGISYDKNELVFIPTKTNTGIDYQIRKPVFISMNDVKADKFISQFIVDKDKETRLKKYILLSGIDSISGFLNHTDYFERFKILEIYYNLYYASNPKRTMQNMIANSFTTKELHSKIILDKFRKSQTDDEIFMNIKNIIIANPDNSMLISQSINLLKSLIPVVNRDTIIKALVSMEHNASAAFSDMTKILSEQYPEIFTELLEYFIDNKNVTTEYFLFQNIIAFTENIKTEKMKNILVKLASNKDLNRTIRLSLLNKINLLLPEIKLSRNQKDILLDTMINGKMLEHKSLMAFINILKETNDPDDIHRIKKVYENKMITQPLKTSIYLAISFIGGEDATDFLIEEFEKNPQDADLQELIALSGSDKAYKTIYNRLLEAKNLTAKHKILKTMKKIKQEHIPASAAQEMIDFINDQNNISDDLFKLIAQVIGKSDTEKALTFFKDTIESEDISGSIKYAAFNVMGKINSPNTYNTIIDLIKNESGSTLAAIDALLQINTDLFPKNAYDEIENLVKKYDDDLDIIFYTLKLLNRINDKTKNMELYKKIIKADEAIPEEDFSELYNDFIEICDDPTLLLEMVTTNQTVVDIKKNALKKLQELDLELKHIQEVIKIIHGETNSMALNIYGATIIADNLNKYYPDLKKHIISSLKDENTDHILKVRYIAILENLDLKYITSDLINAIKLFTTAESLGNENQKAFALINKFDDVLNKKMNMNTNNDHLFQKFEQVTDEDDQLNILDQISFIDSESANMSIADRLLKIIINPNTQYKSTKMTSAAKLIQKKGIYKKMLIDTLIPLIANKDSISPATYKTYIQILHNAGAGHQILLLNKTMVDWHNQGISSKDIAKAFSMLKNNKAEAFKETMAQVINTDSLEWSNISWNNASDEIINEHFIPIKKSATRRDLKRAFKNIYRHLDINLNTDIKLGEEYEIVGRENIPEPYYEIYANGGDTNEIITPPSNPLYQRLFSRNIPPQKAGVHRTVEQRIAFEDAKLINLYCQMFSMANINQNISIGKEINPQSDQLWSIRYDTHSANAYGEGRYLLQTTDWKTHTSGSLMWFFSNYAEKFPLQWIQLRNKMLKALEDYDINIYEYDEKGEEIKSPIIKKHPETQKEITIPKYIYDLTKFPDGEASCAMRLIVNSEAIVDGIVDMILQTTEHIVEGSVEEKKLLAFETLREVYHTVAIGEVPDNFKIYRNINAVKQSLYAMDDYFTNHKEKDMFNKHAKASREQSV